MIVYVEHDVDGNISHVCQIDTAEGPGAPAEIPEPIVEPVNPKERSDARAERAALRAERKARINELITERENATRADLIKQAEGKRMVVLPPGSPVPDAEIHKVDLSTSQIRLLSNVEKKARQDARKAALQQTS